ncbi:hypothetical protein LSTR_LSTR003943 [Laodelphax striatellus]|uniref:Uncharacterized protein n=1 Tax=Laodelphax striatellus TaxID=195883 RepID=A0A482X8N1_LAOST|nr:hypothetical protein LSTR_LSTR003943 [Laodelphax striatellus]
MIEVDTTELDLFNSQNQMQNGIATDDGLHSVKGIKFKEEVITDIVNYTTKRHFGVQPCSMVAFRVENLFPKITISRFESCAGIARGPRS